MLNPRASKILNRLYAESDYTSVNELAGFTKSSNRSVRYNLQKIDEFLVKNGLSPLQRHHLKGVRLDKDEKTVQFLADYFRKESPYQRIYSREEIRLFMVLNLLIHQKEFPISFFETTLNVSRTAVINILSELKTDLAGKDMQLNWAKRKGVFVTGNESAIILEFATLFCKRLSMNEFYNYIELGKMPTGFNGLLFRHIFGKEDLQYIRDLILFLEKELNCTYDDRSFLILSIYFMRLISQAKNNTDVTEKNIPDQPADRRICQISETLLKKMGERYPQIPADEKETAYLMSIISSMKMVKTLQNWPENNAEFADRLIGSIERIYRICFLEHTWELKKMLVQHIAPMMNRIRFHITLENPLFDEIVQNHGQLFANVKTVCKDIGKEYGITVNDQEISYLTIYFATMMKKIAKNEELPGILVVCIEGVAISKYLAASIMKLFHIKQVDTMPIREINDSTIKNYDLVITTVDLPNLDSRKVIRVNSILTRKDMEKLTSRLNLNFGKQTRNHVAKVERLVNVIRESCEIRDLYKLQYDLLLELLNEQEKEVCQPEAILRLKFTRDEIKIREQAAGWKEAVSNGADLLLQKGYIKETYRNRIIRNLEEYGPYMSVAPGVVLAHAGPDDGVVENSMSLVTLENGVDFHDRFSVPVSVIITLALKETHGHLNTAEEIIKLANNQNLVDRIIHSLSRNEVYELVMKSLQLPGGNNL
ncbi:BglG family transcription antiterminator [Thermoactinomyces mirandus]|uniref:BglG family transcription antiterminator n=1 Tax=Thermoactinomyces mirandus TaxID=2756294 RepID=A0A7W1XSH1_9BACL|nr:BglG family transcription antiterminator [Thermoactinomyces mirandus]MBA4602457.1 BglG family transcription antiterminator [Thermoactinomyces mirandus]